jgi:energy-coupling factor transport system permease protein
MSVQGIAVLQEDLFRVNTAHRIKRQRPGIRMIVPAFRMLIHLQLERGAGLADLLAIRGYRSGGRLCPEFTTSGLDMVAGLSAILIFLFAFFPLRDIFILLQCNF